jgi:glycosyltransferase involved in cell wall biosynthesis
MYKEHRVAIVIPARDEARHIVRVISTIPDFIDEVIVVDDASRDGTGEVALACNEARLTVLETGRNQGVGGATLLGYRKGLEMGADLIVKMDGDGQMPPEYLSSLLDTIIDQGYDYAKGNRFLASESLAFMPRPRLFGNVVLTFLTKLASGYWNIFDPQNGYTAIRADALRTLKLEVIHKGYFFENDMLIHLNFQALRVKDVPIPALYGDETSEVSPFHIGATFPFLLLRKFLERIYQKYVLRDFSPIALFLCFGSALFGWGTLFGIYLWIETAITGRPTPTGTIMLALLPLILGFQLLLQAIVLDIQQTPK